MQFFGHYSAILILCLVALTLAGRPASPSDDTVSPIATVQPGSFYIARLPCIDCTVPSPNKFLNGKEEHHENELLLAITLSDDRTSVRVNHYHLYPWRQTPSIVYAEQIYPNFTQDDLDSVVECNRHYQQNQCVLPFYTTVALDYDLGAVDTDVDVEQGTIQREITFDAIGGAHNLRTVKFDRPEQKMLKVVLMGKEIDQMGVLPDLQATSSLFGPFGEEQETLYEYEVLDVQFADRSYKFPPRKYTVWSQIKHFFGFDPVTPNHFVYLHEEWGSYAKKGTLKNAIAIVIYEWPWDLIAIIIGSVGGGLLTFYGLYRLALLGIEQKRLAQWGGMDEAWRQIRRDGDEDGRLLDDEYRDEPDDVLPPAYRDDSSSSTQQLSSKPLPDKPLPDKPLPALPLIEDM